jgi:hypothetical protein
MIKTNPRVYTLELDRIVPYVRTTQRQKWVDPRYKRYAAWKEWARYKANLAGWPTALDPKGGY